MWFPNCVPQYHTDHFLKLESLHFAEDWRRWEDNIKMNMKEIAYEAVDWIGLGHNGAQ
jgi:hypothetical protein